MEVWLFLLGRPRDVRLPEACVPFQIAWLPRELPSSGFEASLNELVSFAELFTEFRSSPVISASSPGRTPAGMS
ncbi:hypothetical protein BST61_g5937 [Cercospora zeina]